MKSNVHKDLPPLMFELGRMMKSEISREGIAMPSFLHLETLRFIQHMKEQGSAPTMSDIADYLKVAPPSATALVNGFVKEGILTRVADPDDRRLVRLVLSEKGKTFLKEIRVKRDHAFKRVISSLSEKDCTELARILTIITKSHS